MIQVQKKIESETIHLPELKPFIGKTVEITVQQQDNVGQTGSEVAKDAGCFSSLAAAKPQSQEEVNALRELLTNEQFDALIEIARQGGPDITRISAIRAESMT